MHGSKQWAQIQLRQMYQQQQEHASIQRPLSLTPFQVKLPRVIKRIYELAWEQFSDLPRGRHKNNSMHKLASKTMIEILPDKLIQHIEAKIGSIATTPDFFDVIGQVILSTSHIFLFLNEI